MSTNDLDIAEIFRAEARERLDRIVTMLLATEGGECAPDAIDSIFRDAHSIKGSAAMVGFDATGALAHIMEDQLGSARERGSLPGELVATLLRATDAIRLSLDSSAAPETAGTQELVSELTAVPAISANPAVAVVISPAPVAPPGPTVERRTIRMPTAKVDRLLDAVGESVVQTRRLEHVLGASGGGGADESTEWELDRGKLMLSELQRAAIDMRTLRFGSITGGYPRAIRDMALAEAREISFEISGAETQLDRVILDGITETIAHLLRNAVAHGIEAPDDRERAGKPRAGSIVLRAEQRGSVVAIEVADDGRGVAAPVVERARQAGTSLAAVLCEPGFSTAASVTDVAGRGVGLDSVRADVESFGGMLEIESTPGAGTVTTMLLPYSVALIRVLLVERGGQVFGLPLASVEETSIVERPLALAGSEAFEVRGRAIPLCDLALILGADFSPLGPRPRAVIVASSGRSQAVACERVLGEQEVLLKSLGELLAGVPGYLGAAIIESGSIAPILDPAYLVQRIAGTARSAVEGTTELPAQKVLVVDDQFTVRELQRSILESAGYDVATARDGRDAYRQIESDPDIELVVTDVEMPEMDGIELLRSIRQNPRSSALPVVVLTSMASEEDKRRGAEVGADAYIVKAEFDQRTLLDTVERLLVR